MNMTLELDIEKYRDPSLIRAFFNKTNSVMLAQQFLFEYNKKICFNNQIQVFVSYIKFI